MSSYVVGLTGGIGSGKSTAADFFGECGITLVDADVISRALSETEEVLAELRQIFGAWAFAADGKLNRAAVRARVFGNDGDDKLRAALEQCLHPRIRATMRAQLAAATSPYAIGVVPLLTEKSGWQDFFNRILVIESSSQNCAARVKARDGIDDAAAILKTQASNNARRAIADDIITNDSALADLRQQVMQHHHQYLAACS